MEVNKLKSAKRINSAIPCGQWKHTKEDIDILDLSNFWWLANWVDTYDNFFFIETIQNITINNNFVIICNEFFIQLSVTNNYQGNLLILFSAKLTHFFFNFMYKNYKGAMYMKSLFPKCYWSSIHFWRDDS